MKIRTENRTKVVCLLCLTGLILWASCVRTTPPRATKVERGQRDDDVFTVFFTGNVQGALKPCGCSGGQLGGLSRRAAILNSVPRERRLVVDTGSFVKSDREQDIIKYNIILRALDLLDYDLIRLSKEDIVIGEDAGLLEDLGSMFKIINAFETDVPGMSSKFTKKFVLKGRAVLLTLATFDVETTPITQAKELFTPSSGIPTLNILIQNCSDPATIQAITKAIPSVDCLICPSESDEPVVISDSDNGPLVFSVGRFGRYVCELKVTAPARVGQRLKLAFRPIKVREELPLAHALVGLYKEYQQIIRDSHLLEKYPRFVLPNGLEYTGSQVCMSCHKPEYEKWSGDAHAHAYATLEGINSQFDPECVTCHVIGMDYESGFISEQQTPHLKDVGCENCHGPGSEHVKTLGKAKFTEPKTACADCHTPEHSGNYPGNERQYAEKIRHWR